MNKIIVRVSNYFLEWNWDAPVEKGEKRGSYVVSPMYAVYNDNEQISPDYVFKGDAFYDALEFRKLVDGMCQISYENGVF